MQDVHPASDPSKPSEGTRCVQCASAQAAPKIPVEMHHAADLCTEPRHRVAFARKTKKTKKLQMFL